MPAYPALFEDVLDTTTTRRKIEAMITLGVPYEQEYGEGFADRANAHLAEQSQKIVANLKAAGVEAPSDLEIISLIAYLQRIGTDIKAGSTAAAQ
jgi:cytochrome c oxidase cbb3-type subunit I/II